MGRIPSKARLNNCLSLPILAMMGGRIACGGETWFDAGAGIMLAPQQRYAGLVFQADENKSFRCAGTLTANYVASDLNGRAMVRVNKIDRAPDIRQTFAQQFHRVRRSGEAHCFVICAHTLGQAHWRKGRFAFLGSAHLQRAGERILRSRTFERLFRQNGETSTLQACAPQTI